MSSATDKANYVGPANVPDQFWQKDVYEAESVGADPYLLAAIAQHETQFGTLGAGQEGYVLGYGYPAPGKGNPVYKGLDNQLFYSGLKVNEFFAGAPITEQGLKDFQDQSWKAADPNWYKGVWQIYQGYNPPNKGESIADSIAKGIQGTPWGAAYNAGASVRKVVDNASSNAAFYATMVIIALVGVFFFTKIWQK